MKVLVVFDIHLADRPPSIRTDAYAEQILDKLRCTADLAEVEKVDAVVWAGDVFHVKAPSRTSHALVQRTVEVIRSYHRPVYIVPGNHDMQHDRLESIERTQPLGVLFKAGAHPLIGDFAGAGMFGIPWLWDWKNDLPAYMREWGASEAQLMVAHAPLMPPGGTRPWESIDAFDWREMMGRPGAVAYGHIHDPDGVFFTPHYDTAFCNEGALSRGSIHEATLRRRPAVSIWDSETGTFERWEVPHLPAEEVFRLDEREVEQTQRQRLDEFLSSVDHAELKGLSVELVLEHVERMDLKELTRQMVREVLEEVMSR